MNTEKAKKNINEIIASRVYKTIVFLGFFVIFIPFTWSIVQGVRFLPMSGEYVSYAVTEMSDIVFGEEKDNMLIIETEKRKIQVGEMMRATWTYAGRKEPENYYFNYSCTSRVVLHIQRNDGVWEKVPCDTNIGVATKSIFMLPESSEDQYAVIDFSIASGALKANATIDVENKEKELVQNAPVVMETENTPVAEEVSAEEMLQTKMIHAIHTNPSDLLVDIREVGVFVNVNGKNIVEPMSPVSGEDTVGVRFVVVNNGGESSGAWSFKAKLPVDGNNSYTYSSPTMRSLFAGEQVEYVLGFDGMLKNATEIVQIEIFPTKATDDTVNNADAIIVKSV